MREYIKYKGKGVIYKITSPTNRVYIGKSIDVYGRYKNYKNGCMEKQPILYRSVLKHGWENHKFEIVEVIEGSTEEELNKQERYWIRKLKTNVTKYRDHRGLNCTDGGEGTSGMVHSEEFREKCRRRMIGNKYGVGISTPSSLKGKRLPKTWRDNVNKARQNRDHIPRMSKTVLNLCTGIYYDSLNKAAKSINKSAQWLSKEISRPDNQSDFIIVQQDKEYYANSRPQNLPANNEDERYKKRLRAKNRVEITCFNYKTKQVDTYNSLTECANKMGIPLGVIRSRLLSNSPYGNIYFKTKQPYGEVPHNHRGVRLSTRHRKALSDNSPRNIPVEVYTPQGKKVGEYKSCQQASLDTGIPNKCITECVNGDLTHAGNLIFKKKGEMLSSDDLMAYHMLKYTDNVLLDTQSGIYYESYSDAARAFGLNQSTVKRQVSGVYKNKTSLILT